MADRPRGWSNFLCCGNSIARERGIAAYRAWLPLEAHKAGRLPASGMGGRVRLAGEQRAALPPLPQRILHGASLHAVFGGAAVLLQYFTPFPVLTWLRGLV